MKYNLLGNQKISEIGLGTWQLGSADWGVVDEGKALELLFAFQEAGGNFIDTADVYGLGVSEKIIGKFLQSARSDGQQLWVATKLGRRHDGHNGWPQNFTYAKMKEHTEKSLEHLQIDSIFLQQLHCIPAEELEKGEVFDHLRRLKQDGLIQHWGVSVETSSEARRCLQEEGLSSLQIIFNLFRQHPADIFFEEAQQKKVALIARVPLASGLLTGKFNASTHFDAQDHRHYNAGGKVFNAGETFSGIPFQEGVKMAQNFKEMLPPGELAKWSLRWILQHEAITTVIPGARSTEQVLSNIAAASYAPIPSEVRKTLRAYYEEQVLPQIQGVY